MFDTELTFAVHIRRLAGKCFYHLRQLRTVRRTLTTDAAKTVVHDFINGRMDYCNSVFGNASAVHLYPLQSVLNAAARVITRKRECDHISAIICDLLHWLPVKQRIDYKLCTLIYKCLHNVAPVYLRKEVSKYVELVTRHMWTGLSWVTYVYQCHRYRVAPVSVQLLTATCGISAQEQKHLILVLLRCLDHPYGIHYLQLLAMDHPYGIHYLQLLAIHY